MDASYHFDVDPDRGVMRLTLRGFYDEAAMRALLAARAEAHGRLGPQPDGHLTLVDIRDMKIQSQDIVGAFHVMLGDPRFAARRLGFVVGTTLARSQLNRALGSRDARTFTSIAEAEAWLFARDDAAG